MNWAIVILLLLVVVYANALLHSAKEKGRVDVVRCSVAIVLVIILLIGVCVYG